MTCEHEFEWREVKMPTVTNCRPFRLTCLKCKASMAFIDIAEEKAIELFTECLQE